MGKDGAVKMSGWEKRPAVLVAWVVLFSSLNSPAVTERRYWIFEQSDTPRPTSFGESRSQLSLDFRNVSDSSSVLLSGLGDLRYLEIVLKGHQRFFFSRSEEGTFLKERLFPDRQSLAVELARYHVTSKNHYGRLAVEGIYFHPSSTKYWKGGVQTGILRTVDFPWNLALGINFFRPMQKGSNPFTVVYGQSAKSYALSPQADLDLGGFLSWTYRIKPASLGAGIYEHMVFTLGPVGEIHTSSHKVRFALRWSIRMDKEVFTVSGGNQEVYPSELRPYPDVSATYAWVF